MPGPPPDGKDAQRPGAQPERPDRRHWLRQALGHAGAVPATLAARELMAWGGLGALAGLGALSTPTAAVAGGPADMTDMAAYAAGAAAAAAAPDVGLDAFDSGVQAGRPLVFPRDHGAHRGTGIEWWYLTGWLTPSPPPTAADAAATDQPLQAVSAGQALPRYGFQVTFFRRRMAVADRPRPLSDGRFSPRHLLMAHAAVTDLGPDATSPTMRTGTPGPAPGDPGDTGANGSPAHTADRAGGEPQPATGERPTPEASADTQASRATHRATRSGTPRANHRHAQRLVRWSGDPTVPEAHAAIADTEVRLGTWWLRRDPGRDPGPDPGRLPDDATHAPTPATRPPAPHNAAQDSGTDSPQLPHTSHPAGTYRTGIDAPSSGFALNLSLAATQPVLLQGQAGFSRKGPQPVQASHYYTQPQLAASGTLEIDGRRMGVTGRAWLDHEWSDALLDTAAVGWDWIGINLLDGGALTAFQLRRADGSALWTGGSWRRADGQQVDFSGQPLRFTPGRSWTSPVTGGVYPVTWTLDTPAGRFSLQALADAQELDSRASTGTVYWEGLAELTDTQGRRVGLGYLEMTGRVGRLRIGG